MKKGVFKKQKKRVQKDREVRQEWLDKLVEHPVPDIQVELFAMYQKLTGDGKIKRAKYNDNNDDIILETEDGKNILVWQSPVSQTVRYGPHSKPWPVSDESLWPLSGERTYQVPHLSRDIWECICRFSDPETLLALSLVSKSVRAVVCKPRASWWETRRAALVRDYPGLVLPDALWKWYGRWEALANGSVNPTYNDYSNFCVLSLPPGVMSYTRENGDIREPSLAYYSGAVKNRAGNCRTFKRVMGHARVRDSPVHLCILQTVAPCRLLMCWGSTWCTKLWKNVNWQFYTKRLLHDRPLESYLKKWQKYKELEATK